MVQLIEAGFVLGFYGGLLVLAVIISEAIGFVADWHGTKKRKEKIARLKRP